VSGHAAQARRLLALALIYDGSSRSDAARLGNVTRQIVRDWVIRFNATAPDGLVDGKALKRWDGFARFLDDGQICLTNNTAERALRGIALGRIN
jgi:hypothetical protein